jgi:Ras-related GTP-binding protein C/D
VVKLVEFIVAACQVNPNINLEVFVHKAEKLQEDDKIGRPLRLPETDQLG